VADSSSNTSHAHGLSASPIVVALVLSLGAAVSLGITRFAYGLLLPPMRADLGWSYTLAGSMNTSNAFGYFIGALMAPALLRRFGAGSVLVIGSLLASVFMALSGFFTDSVWLLAQRALAGIASALVFVCGGVLAARLGATDPKRGGLLLGIYYGGTGIGIVLSALIVPALLAYAANARWLGFAGWAWAWWALAFVCVFASVLLAWPARVMQPLMSAAGNSSAQDRSFRVSAFAYSLAGYAMFGVGYIGYMTFVIALLREQGASDALVTGFYAILGVAVMASSRVWAGLLDRHKNGRALATLNALLALAVLLPALTNSFPIVLFSGVLFGGVFLSVVASTTALVRHNLPAHQWAGGISAFTTVFAAGQIVGPVIVGLIADGSAMSNADSLARGLLFSAVALAVGAFLASRQRAL